MEWTLDPNVINDLYLQDYPDEFKAPLCEMLYIYTARDNCCFKELTI